MEDSGLLTNRYPQRHGQLSPSDELTAALEDTYNYQKSHIDTFVRALDLFKVREPDADGLQVIDIGAGACTTRFAMEQHWPQTLQYIDYKPIEPNNGMRHLGEQLSTIFGWDSPSYLQDIQEITPAYSPVAKRCLITMSYVIGQNTFTDHDIWKLSKFIKETINKLWLPPVEILITTATTAKSKENWNDLFLHFKHDKKLNPIQVHIDEAGRGVWQSGPSMHQEQLPQKYPTPSGGWTTNYPKNKKVGNCHKINNNFKPIDHEACHL